MQIKIDQIKLSLDEDESLLLEKIKKRINKDIKSYEILRKSLDARRKETPCFNYQVLVETELSEKELYFLKTKGITAYQEQEDSIDFGTQMLDKSPIVVGFGPAGLFCAYELAKYGFAPIVFEQGEMVEDRVKSVKYFWTSGKLNPFSNVQFGEGGAGTFSDGKLTSRSKSPLIRYVLETFAFHGAPKEILYDKKPHIGTDLLRPIIASIREAIIRMGGSVHFNTEVTDFIFEKNKVTGVLLANGQVIYSDNVILASGHSARALFKKLAEHKVAMENKPFAIGFRIEHPQDFVNKHQYREFYKHQRLGSADYQLTAYLKALDRGVYTFCMCPGGEVVMASSEEGRSVVNGMSYHSRDMENANSAVLITIDERDYGTKLLNGLFYQERLESAVYKLTNKPHVAPVQRLEDFFEGRKTRQLGKVIPSIKNYELSDLSKLLPEYLYEALKEGFLGLEEKFSNFCMADAILTGMETRSSSPVKILRDKESFASLSHAGFYPIGEGAGYAGGIVSSAIDGIKIARALIKTYAPPDLSK